MSSRQCVTSVPANAQCIPVSLQDRILRTSYFLLQPFIGDSGKDLKGGFNEGEEKSRSWSWGSWRWRLAVLLSQDGRQDRHELVPGFVDLRGEVGREACGQCDQQTVGQELRREENFRAQCSGDSTAFFSSSSLLTSPSILTNPP